MAAEPEELERRIRRLEALFSVVLLSDTAEEMPSKEWDMMLRRLLRRQEEPDFFFEDLYMYLREFGFPHRGRLRERIDDLAARFDKLQASSAEFSESVSKFQHRLQPLADFRPSFDRLVESSIPQLQSEVRSLTGSQERLQNELHSYLVAQSLGLDPNQIPLHRFVPVRVYLPEDDPKAVNRISKAITGLLDAFDFEVSDDFPPEKRSWFKRWFAKSKDTLTQPEVTDRLKKVERAIELAQLQERQASIDEKQAKATRDIMAALENTPDAVCLVGSILTVKITNAESPRVYVRSLTPEEMIFLSQNQHLLKSPDTNLECLSSCNKNVGVVDGSPVGRIGADREDGG